MPLVRISIPKIIGRERQTALGDAVHRAMVETINVPEADRFQIHSRHEPEDLIINKSFLDINRSDQAVIVHITLRAGRTNDQKRALYQRITTLAQSAAEICPADIMIVLAENSSPDWSFGEGIAQYLPSD